ncbi:MAG: T9SS type A sorting domain-containing protein [Chitinophagales bacterium]|nr:T9SS type A sorting domain-containing protein [Chitinophagales bacterium]
MKIKFILSFLVIFIFISCWRTSATIYIITNHFELYDPDSITINLGDTVLFQLDSFHNALEVNHATWDSGFAISNGGFYTPFGGGIWVADTAGTYYYVCELHAHDGMVGRIFVLDPNGISLPDKSSSKEISLFPNPAIDFVNVSLGNELLFHDLKFLMVDVNGKNVREIDFAKSDSHITIPIADISDGVYFISVFSNNKFFNSKLIIE